MDFNYSIYARNMGSTVSWIENSQSMTDNINVGMCPSLMGTFNFQASMSYICATPVGYQNSSSPASVTRLSSFITLYLQDPWVLPSSYEMVEGHTHVRMDTPLYRTKVAYQAIKKATVDSDQTPSWKKEDD
jgi:hypothetical protein